MKHYLNDRSVIAFVICFIATLFLAEKVDDSEEKKNLLKLDAHADLVSSQFNQELNHMLLSINRMSRRFFKGSEQISKRDWKVDAINYCKDISIIQAIEYVDPDYYVRWVQPIRGNEAALNLYLGFEEKRRKALIEAKNSLTPTVTPVIKLVQGNLGILHYNPLYVDSDFKGFLLAVYNAEELFKQVFKDFLENYHFEIYQNKELIFATDTKSRQNSALTIDKTFSFDEHILDFRMIPKPRFLKEIDSGVSKLVYIFGLILSVSVSILIHFLIKSKKSEAAHEKSEKNLRAILDEVNDGYWEWEMTPEGELTSFVFISSALKHKLGYEDKDLPNTLSAYKELMSSEDYEAVTQKLRSHIDSIGAIPFSAEIGLKKKDGTLLYVLSKGVAVRDPMTNVYKRVVGTFSDISTLKNNEVALLESEARFSLAMDASLSGLWDWPNVNEDSVWWSDRFYEIIGYDRENLPSSLENFKLILHPDDILKTLNEVERCIKNQVPFSLEYRLKHRKGYYVWIRAKASVLKEAFDKPMRMIGTITNIHEEKLSTERFERAIESAPSGMIIVNKHAIIVYVNEKILEIFKYKRSELINQLIEILVPDSVKERHPQLRNEYLDQASDKKLNDGREILARRKNGEEFYAEVALNPIYLNDDTYVITSVTDVTRRVNLEVEKTEMIEKLRKNNEELDDFTYIISHDLKEPIRGIQQQCSFLKEDYEDVFDEEGVKRLDKLIQNGMRFQELLSQILQYHRIGRDEIETKTVDFNEEVKKVISELELYIEESKAVIQVKNILPSVKAERLRMNIVIRNIIANAIKYNDSEKKRVEIYSEEDNKGEPILCFKDNGIGIDSAHYKNVFKMFRRLHARNKYQGGTGSGLAMVKKIIDSHHGKIWLESKKGVGTIFKIKLPS